MSTPPSPSSSRRRGGQPGNQNALKHGFYSRYFNTVDRQDLENYSFSGLHDEIVLVRIYIRNLVEMATHPDCPYDALVILRALSAACSNLTRLLKTQKLVFEKSEESSLREMLDRVVLETQIAQNWPIIGKD